MTSTSTAHPTDEALERAVERSLRFDGVASLHGVGLRPTFADTAIMTKDVLAAAVRADLHARAEPGGALVFASGGTQNAPTLSLIPAHMFVPEILAASSLSLGADDVIVNMLTPGRLWSAHYFYNEMARVVGARVLAFGPVDPDEAMTWWRFFVDNAATVLAVTPSSLAVLLDAIEESGRPENSIRVVMWTGEALPDALYDRVHRWLPHAELHGAYGSTETWVVGTSGPHCPPRTFHRVPHQHVEFAPDGLLVTTIHDDVINPVVRYRIGDRAEPGDCPCGRSDAFTVTGRVDDGVKFRNQLLRGSEIADLCREIALVDEVQVVVVAGDPDDLEVRVRRAGEQFRADELQMMARRLLDGHLELGYVVGERDTDSVTVTTTPFWTNPRTAKTPPVVYVGG